MKLEGNCMTTAMGIMPHRDLEKALQLALSLDIPFWPQLPRLSFYEDMYVQLSEHFPGISLDPERRLVRFSLEQFYMDLEEYTAHWDDQSYFSLSPRYSAVYHRFLEQDLSRYRYIRGQSIGPVSFGLKILDADQKPMIYYDEVREIIFDFVAKKLQAQYRELQAVHAAPCVRHQNVDGAAFPFQARHSVPHRLAASHIAGEGQSPAAEAVNFTRELGQPLPAPGEQAHPRSVAC